MHLDDPLFTQHSLFSNGAFCKENHFKIIL